MKKFAVVLSGCGVFDGAEIHEATLTMLAIKKQGADYQIFAPDIDQHHVINHYSGKEMKEKESRNVLVESARIARGDIKPLDEFNSSKFDALLFPGGFGAAKNLSSIAFKGSEAEVDEEVKRAVKEMLAAKKPIGALCISPAVIAKIIGDVKVTIGQEEDTAKAIEAMGATHITTDHGDVVIDDNKMVFTTPCYMLEADITQVWDGAYNIVEAMMKFME
ncbi:MAG: isoprenoid biosynthesis glyoxalase ElbB [Bacteroidetes bacterium]|nr:isoprenoid biosynthesis glyoxalase ElbB [Bacteroidota bacterium]